MIDFSKYVLSNEICKKTKKQFVQLIKPQFHDDKSILVHLRGVCLIRKECIKEEYSYIFKDCIDMNDYRPIQFLSTFLGMSHNYLASVAEKFEIECIYVGRLRLVKLTEEFKTLLKQDNIFYIKNRFDKWDEDSNVFKFYGLEIGYY